MIISLSNPMIEFPETSDQAQFELNVPEKNGLLADYQKANGRIVKVLGHDMLVASANMYWQSMTLLKENRVVYWTTYSLTRFLDRDQITQHVVWSDALKSPKGLARRIMTDYFLKNHDSLATSEIQFPLGAKMWKKFMMDCLGQYFVYLSANSSIYCQIENKKMLIAMEKDIWGTTLRHKLIKPVVSNKRLL